MPLNHPHPPTVHLSSSSQFCETAFIPFLFFPGNFFNCNILVVTGASCEGSVPPRGVLPPPRLHHTLGPPLDAHTEGGISISLLR